MWANPAASAGAAMLPSSLALSQTANERSHLIVRPDKHKSLASAGR
jgi:hypothetical protein